MDPLSQMLHNALTIVASILPTNGPLGNPPRPRASDNGPDQSGNGIQPSYIGYEASQAPTVAHYPSAPFAMRSEGNDLQSWLEPTQQDRNNWQTFFQGNQLPGFNINSPIGGYGSLNTLHIESPSRDAATFGPQLGQLNQQSLLQRWQGIWRAASGS